MSRIQPPPDPVCGACLHFEPARDPKYGYCKLQMALARERSLRYPDIHLHDVTTVCSMLRSPSGVPAFEAKETPHETT